MTSLQVAQVFSAKKTGRGKWVAKCPAHPDRRPSLGIWEGDRWVQIKCWSHGCDLQAILSSVGLTVEQLAYDSGKRMDSRTLRQSQLQREAEEKRASELRIGTWILRFIENGYTREDRDSDLAVLCACAIVLTNKPSRAWEGILRTTTERMIAAEHCLSRRMLPAVAKERWA